MKYSLRSLMVVVLVLGIALPMTVASNLRMERLPMRFSIRDLLWCTLAVALAVGCLVVHNGNIFTEKKAMALEKVLEAEDWNVDHYGSEIVVSRWATSQAYVIRKGELTRLPKSQALAPYQPGSSPPAPNPPKE